MKKLILTLVLLSITAVCNAAYQTDNLTITSLPSKSSLATDSNGKIIEGTAGSGNLTQNGTITPGNFTSGGAVAGELVDSGYSTADAINWSVVEIAEINATGTPGSGTYLRGDGSWQAVAGSGNVTNNGTSTGGNFSSFEDDNSTVIIDSGYGPTDFITVETDPSVDTADKIEAILTNDNITFGTGIVTAAGFVGPLTGEVTGNISGNAATATTASDSTDNTSIQYSLITQGATVYMQPRFQFINGTNMTFTLVNDTTTKQVNITGEVKAGVYQPADADLDDLADGSLTGSKVSDAAADATTKGVSTYNASDFNSASGLIALDYANGQAASTNTHGFLTDTDWTTFNNSIDTEVDPTVDTSAEILAIIGNYAIPGIRITNGTINSTQITDYSIVAADVTNYTLTGTQINNTSNITVNTLTATGGTGVSSFTGPDDGVTVTISINAASAAVTAADTFINFNSSAGAIGSIGGTAVSGVVAYNTMTFSHYTQVIDKTNIEPSMLLEIVEGKPDFDKKQLFKTRICRTKKSKQAIGTFGGTNKDGYDLCLAGGTAFVFVKNTGRNIGIGDLFYSSDMPGCVELQNDNILHSYTVAKATEPIRWKSEERKRLISCILLGG